MRISTSQIFERSLLTMQAQQSRLQRAEQQLATGLRILTPSDDPTAAVKVLDLQDNIAVLDQYEKNIAIAQSRLNEEEGALVGINTSLQRVRELTVQGANATQTPETRATIAAEMTQRLEELLDLANSRDAGGEYIFAGSRVAAPPFGRNNATVTYAGDQQQRLMQIGEGSQIAVRDTGDRVFLRIPGGDGTLEVMPESSNLGSLVVGQYGAIGATSRTSYALSFSQPAIGDPITYSVSDDAAPPNVVATGTYTENDSIEFAGVRIYFSGSPADGDSVNIQPSVNHSVFDIVQSTIDALGQPTPGATEQAAFSNSINQSLHNLDQAISHFSSVRADVGARFNTIEQQENVNSDFKLDLQTVLSDTQDLDYAEAISRFNLQLTSLQAAQQAYVKVQELSLFRFL